MLVYYSHRDRLFDDEGDELTERAIRRVTDGKTVKLFDFDRPLALAVDRGRIALVSDGRGEVRLPDASIVASFKFLGSPKAVALDGATAAVLIERGSRSKVIALFDASSGKAQGEVRVAPGVTSLSAGGGWVVYGEGRSIRGFKAQVRAVRLHFRARRIPHAVSATGRRVAWFENHRGRGQILAFTLPH